MRRASLVILFLAPFACTAPPAPAPGTGSAWGYLRVVPREGVGLPRSDAAYGDRRMRSAHLVDYSRPGFAVVYVERPVEEQPKPRSEPLVVEVRSGRVGVQLAPRMAALPVGSRVLVVNRTEEEHLLSWPIAGIVRPLPPGESFETSVTLAGEHAIHLLGGSTASTTLFAAPGAHDVVSAAGRFQLEDLRPGRVRLRAWHPRFPPAERWLQIEAGSVARADVLMGVGQGKDSSRAD